jgi:hypothetical protein
VVSALRDYVFAPAVEPAVGAAAPVAAAAVAPAIAVVADPADAAPLAAAVALVAAAVHRAPCALVVLRGARRVPAAGPARAAARRLAASLAARGLDAVPAGRLVAVTVDGGEGTEAAAAADRALAAAASASAVAVVGLGAPREPALDRLIAGCDLGLVLVRPGQEPVLELAVEGLADLGVPATGTVTQVGPCTRLLAARGLAVPPAVRAAVGPLLGSSSRSAREPA